MYFGVALVFLYSVFCILLLNRTSIHTLHPPVQGFSERVVDALADYGIPFECTYKAVMEWDTTKEHFAALIASQFTGAELKELIANDIQLSKVTDIINRCSQVGTGNGAKAGTGQKWDWGSGREGPGREQGQDREGRCKIRRAGARYGGQGPGT